MAKQSSLDVESLRKDIHYDPQTGQFTLLQDINNKAKKGKVIGYLSKGYVKVPYKGLRISGHRLAWALTHGVWPDKEVDHINLDRSDNRLSNLRLATRSQNAMNRKPLSGRYCGVSLHKPTGRYQSRITVNGITKYLGVFGTEEEAAAEYNKYAKVFHGEFARLND